MAIENIVILTGAGISAESGLATFRDTGGVWAKYDYREVATPEGFEANPDLVHDFYNYRRREAQKVLPNAAHHALAELEEALSERGGQLTLVTQNVDDLHARAGSQNILQMHGELLKVVCQFCDGVHLWHEDLSPKTQCPTCLKSAGMRPYIVWFGEMPRFMDEIEMAVEEADMFVSIGTSGSVYPAAGLVHQARALGIRTVELNLEPSENAHQFDETDYGPASEIIPKWVNGVIQGL